MNEIRRASLIGAGAVGTVLAVRLQACLGEGFSLIADPTRQERLRRDGILFNGVRHDFPFAKEGTEQELILIATKATALPEVMERITPYIGADTLILSLLNGIDSEERLAARFGAEHLLYSYFLGHPSMREGNSIAHDGTYRIYFGEAENRAVSERVERVRHLFDRARIPYAIPQDMRAALWQKFIINIGCNQTTALLRRPYGHLQTNTQALRLARRMMDEAAEVARRIGLPNPQEMVEEAVRVIRSMNPEGKSSMQQDVEAGRETEIEIFAGTLCRLADSMGYDVPWNRAAYQIISAL